jgi:hypothetical protein
LTYNIIHDHELRRLVIDLHRAVDLLADLRAGAPPELLGTTLAAAAIRKAAQTLAELRIALHEERERWHAHREGDGR